MSQHSHPNAAGSGKPLDSIELSETIAVMSRNIWRAKFYLFIIKPLMVVCGLALYAAGLYAGTWIVVLALRHSGAIS